VFTGEVRPPLTAKGRNSACSGRDNRSVEFGFDLASFQCLGSVFYQLGCGFGELRRSAAGAPPLDHCSRPEFFFPSPRSNLDRSLEIERTLFTHTGSVWCFTKETLPFC
jgi:hypothetical protein